MDDLDPARRKALKIWQSASSNSTSVPTSRLTRALQRQTIHANGFLPGTRLERVPLTRTTLSDMLRGRKFPGKAFLLTFVEACGVDLEKEFLWRQAWDRIAPQYRARYRDRGGRKDPPGKRRTPSATRRDRAPGRSRPNSKPGSVRPALGLGRRASRRSRAAGGGGRLCQENEGLGQQFAIAGRQDVFDPDVIKWRLDVTPSYQMRSLTELRQAIEPPAAFLAAQRASGDVRRDLVILSRRLQELGTNRDFSKDNPAGRRTRKDYQDVDARFHQALLNGSQNDMFCALKDPVIQALSYRIHREWEGARGRGSGAGGTKRFPAQPAPLALWLHRGLAAAVEQGHAAAAETFSRAILAEIGADPLPLTDGIALEHALALLDPGSMEAEGAGCERFRHAIWSAVLSPRASAGALGPVAVMGVAGCGKTTIGQLLAEYLRVHYAEADSFHPAGNVSKMAKGVALTDQDREPWLEAIAESIRQDGPVVVSCSALKHAYRDVLRRADPRTWFLHLAVDRETAKARVTGRATHFMPASLVDSQFKDLEPLREQEAGLTVDGSLPPEQIITAAMRALAAAVDYAPASARSSSSVPGTCKSCGCPRC